MRLLPALTVFFICAGYGFAKSAELKKRAVFLEELTRLLTELSVAIGSTAPPLDRLCSECTGVFMQLVREQAASAPDIRAAWGQAVQQLERCRFCRDEEVQLLRALGQELGSCAAEGQLALLKLHGARAARLCEAAREESRSRGKMLRSVGTLCGIGAAILLV